MEATLADKSEEMKRTVEGYEERVGQFEAEKNQYTDRQTELMTDLDSMQQYIDEISAKLALAQLDASQIDQVK